MTNYSIILAPSGVGIEKTIKKLKKINRDIKWIDIEDILCKRLQETRLCLKKLGKSLVKPPRICMYDVTWCLPRLKVEELWKSAVQQSLGELADSPGKIKILTGHLIYYCGQRDEFFSAFNTSYLLTRSRSLGLKVSHVLLLVDDVYDMFLRLTKPNQIYQDYPSVLNYTSRVEETEGISSKKLKKKDKCSIYIEWQMASLTKILYWRQLENIIAENVSSQLKSHFLIWGVKQSSSVVLDWLKNPKPTAVYLSHPISRARRKKKEGSNWPVYVKEINKMQQLLSTHQITCVMPTAIDELRFKVVKSKSRNSLNFYSGYLDDRWPLPRGLKKLLYTIPQNYGNIHHRNILKPKTLNETNRCLDKVQHFTTYIREKINTNVRTFINQIYSQIASRDHCLVSRTKGLIVYRPFYGGSQNFSSGVDKEIAHWKDLVNSGVVSRCVFIHTNNDCSSMLQERGKSVKGELKKEICDILKKKYPRIAKESIDNIVAGKRGADALGLGEIVPQLQDKIKSKIPMACKEAKTRLLERYLSGIVKVDPYMYGIWILASPKKIIEVQGDICKFILKGEPRGNNWRMKIDSLFPNKVKGN